MHIQKRILAVVAAVALAACAAPAPRPELDSSHITTGMLLVSSPLAAPGSVPDQPEVDILGLSPDMIEFVDAYVDPDRREYDRLKRLIYAIMGEGKFQLVYDDDTRTAQETFRDQRGNCLSFTNMFVAMARHVGLDARYQEVEIPPDWSLAGQSFMLSQHVNVYVDFGHDFSRVVDFNIYNFTTSYGRTIIPDSRARAHYFNNIGVEHMLGGDTVQALSNFRAGILADGTFAPAWINLGTLYRREGHPAYAEAAYLKALEADRFNLVGMSNLASLYEQEGLEALAAEYRERVINHRMQNPYYRYFLASESFVSGDYDAAIENLRFAIRKHQDEPRFYSLMSLSYLMSGDKAAAERWMKQAEELATRESERQRYHSKLEWLMSQGAEQ